MDQWQDHGIVLSTRGHGENGAVVALLTEHHGRHAGYVRGAHSSRLRGILQPGTLLSANWSSRMADGLGAYTLEEQHGLATAVLDDPLRLTALMSACSLCDLAVPEREGQPGLFHGLVALLQMLEGDIWPAAYIMWELALLRELGFGVDLTRCAAGGDSTDLAYVSPKTGRAVSRAAAGPYKEKLLPLPAFLRPSSDGEMHLNNADIVEALNLTGYFLEHWVFAHTTAVLPDARRRLVERLQGDSACKTAAFV